ncbi:MAG: hypothetical protein NVSMB38_17310 [Ktedonobacteraceae bacterium]
MSFFTDLFNHVFTYPIFNALMVLYHVVGDFGLAIILLTCVISVLLLPLTLHQLRQAKATRALQPRLAEIRNQHPNDRVAQTQATQALYKEYGIHPASPFLSLLVQAPIYSGLFFALSTVLHARSVIAINTIMYPFLYHFTSLPNINLIWFTVINSAWHFSLGYPDPTHLLPLLTGFFTFIQMRMAQPVPLTETRDAALQLSQGMQLLMLLVPVGITLFFAWQFAAGLALYRLISLTFNMVQQYITTGWGSLWVSPIAAQGAGITTPIQTQTSNIKVRRPHRGSSRTRRKKPRRDK